jgi:glycosyltransferase involved in cell wall biosynthesis
MRVLFFWTKAKTLSLADCLNPYGPLLAGAMEKIDIHFESADYAFERGWLEKKRRDFDVLHVNWLHPFYWSDDLGSSEKRLNHFVDNVYYARSLGYRIVWTLHNLYPHERPYPDLDQLARQAMCEVSDAVVAHCHYAADRARELFHLDDRLRVIPHGNYIDAYPNTISKEDAREELGLPPGAFVYLFFGHARPYKGIEGLIEAFRTIAGKEDRLVLAMNSGLFSEYGEKIERSVEDDPRIRSFTRSFFKTDDCQIYFNAADTVVLPFVDVLTSGSAILALSFGKPVVLPRLGCMPEVANDSMGEMFDPKGPDDLTKAMSDIRSRDLEAVSRAAYERAEALDWDGIARQFAELYQQ